VTLQGPASMPPRLGDHPEYDVVVRSYVQADRNMVGTRFPHALGPDEARDSRASLGAAARACGYSVARVGDLDAPCRSNLAERELYSRPYLLDDDNLAVLKRDSAAWLAVNDANHLSMRAALPGLDLEAAWDIVSAADDQLSDCLGDRPWAFDTGIGYIMSEASRCGSGLSARVTLHAPGLAISGLAETAFKRAMEAGFVVSGLYSSLAASGGSLFDLSLPYACRDPERAALGRLSSAARAIAEYERRARAELLSASPWDILDTIGRAAGKAAGARLLSRDEAADICSGLRLGLALGVLEGLSLEDATDLWPALRVKPAQADGEPEAALRATSLRRAVAGLRFSQGYIDV